MALVLSTGPAIEPLSLDEVKAHLRVDHDDEDVLLASLLTTARIHLETLLGLAFISQTWKYVLDEWPVDQPLSLPLAPIQSVDLIELYDQDDQASPVTASDYALDALSEPPRLYWRGETSRPSPERRFNGIEITLGVGYGVNATDVPQPLRQAILLLVAHWYEHREPVDLHHTAREIPQMVSMLTNAYRRISL